MHEIKVAVAVLKLKYINKLAFRRNGPQASDAGLLTFFSRRIIHHQSPSDVLTTKLKEATSLDVEKLALESIPSIVYKADDDSVVKFCPVVAILPTDEFYVYDGEGPQFIRPAIAKVRDDLAPWTRYILARLPKLS